MYNHPNTLALAGAGAAAPAMFGDLWMAIGLVTLLFALLALWRLRPREEK